MLQPPAIVVFCNVFFYVLCSVFCFLQCVLLHLAAHRPGLLYLGVGTKSRRRKRFIKNNRSNNCTTGQRNNCTTGQRNIVQAAQQGTIVQPAQGASSSRNTCTTRVRIGWLKGQVPNTSFCSEDVSTSSWTIKPSPLKSNKWQNPTASHVNVEEV